MYELIMFHINDYPKVIGSNLTKEKAEKYAEKLNKKCCWMQCYVATPMT